MCNISDMCKFPLPARLAPVLLPPFFCSPPCRGFAARGARLRHRRCKASPPEVRVNPCLMWGGATHSTRIKKGAKLIHATKFSKEYVNHCLVGNIVFFVTKKLVFHKYDFSKIKQKQSIFVVSVVCESPTPKKK